LNSNEEKKLYYLGRGKRKKKGKSFLASGKVRSLLLLWESHLPISPQEKSERQGKKKGGKGTTPQRPRKASL